GCIDMQDYTERLIEMVGAGQQHTPKYEKLCAEVIDKREQKKERHIQLANEMLARLAVEADARGIKLGVENREALEEIPLESDFTLFLKEFNAPAICYWHDTGHAQIKENLGFIHHGMHLGSLSDRGLRVADVLDSPLHFPQRRPAGLGAARPLLEWAGAGTAMARGVVGGASRTPAHIDVG